MIVPATVPACSIRLAGEYCAWVEPTGIVKFTVRPPDVNITFGSSALLMAFGVKPIVTCPVIGTGYALARLICIGCCWVGLRFCGSKYVTFGRLGNGFMVNTK